MRLQPQMLSFEDARLRAKWEQRILSWLKEAKVDVANIAFTVTKGERVVCSGYVWQNTADGSGGTFHPITRRVSIAIQSTINITKFMFCHELGHIKQFNENHECFEDLGERASQEMDASRFALSCGALPTRCIQTSGRQWGFNFYKCNGNYFIRRVKKCERKKRETN